MAFANLHYANIPNADKMEYSVSTFYNRVFTAGELIKRPRKVYHEWKEEGLIPAHFGKDYWWQFPEIITFSELEGKQWDKLNFVEAAWVKLVDILRRHGYPKKQIIHFADLYFRIDKEQKALFAKVLAERKDELTQRFRGITKDMGLEHAKDDINTAFREYCADLQFGLFDRLLLGAIYNREPLIFIASHSGPLIPLLEGQKVEPIYQSFYDEITRAPYIVIPFYKEIESMLLDPEYSRFSRPITLLNDAESLLIKAIRNKKVKEVNVKKNSQQDELTIKQHENGYITIGDERALMRLMRSKDYKRIEFIDVDGKKKFFEGEKIQKIKVPK
jgi:hypothetical protein